MKALLLLPIHLVAVIARLLGSGGACGLVAENLLVKQQLLILSRTPSEGVESLISGQDRAGSLHLVRCTQPNTQGRRRRQGVYAAQAPPVPGSAQLSDIVLRATNGEEAGPEGPARGTRPDHCRVEAT